MLFEKIKLEADEEVLRTVRKHWFIIGSELLGILLVTLIPIVLIIIGFSYEEQIAAVGLDLRANLPLLLLLSAAWMLLSTLSGFMIWTNYYLDLWVITDRRIIYIDQIHFFNRNVAIFRLERLQDIEFSINGLLPTFLNFGSLSAQTAGHNEHNFKTAGMPDPRTLQAIIQSAMDRRLKALHINHPVLE